MGLRNPIGADLPISADVIEQTIEALAASREAALSKAAAEGLPERTEVVDWIERTKRLVLTQPERSALRSELPWLASRLGHKADIGRHLCAVSAAPERAVQFGVPAARIFPMWDWVGGRYSLWSAIGLPIALSIGMRRFDEMRAESWFYVGENDVFPETFLRFLGFEGRLNEAFLAKHGEILDAGWWRALQDRLRAGELVEVLPYHPHRVRVASSM